VPSLGFLESAFLDGGNFWPAQRQSHIVKNFDIVPETLYFSTHRFPLKEKWKVDPLTQVYSQENPFPSYIRNSVLVTVDTTSVETLPWRGSRMTPLACQKAFSKYYKKTPSFSALTSEQVRAWDKAWLWAYYHYAPSCGNSTVLTYNEFLSLYTKRASNGAILSQEWVDKEDFVVNNKEVLLDYWDQQALRLFVRNILSGYLKAELRTKEKCDLEKTRAFLGVSVLDAYLGLTLFYDQCSRGHSSGATWSWVGKNAWGGGWHRLWIYLKEFQKPNDLDGENWDGGLIAMFFCKLALFRYSLLSHVYRTQDNFIRVINYYWGNCFGLIVLPDGGVVAKTHSQVSGCFTTIDDNGVANFVANGFSYILRYPNHSYQQWQKTVHGQTCGDDLLFSSQPGYFDAYDVISGARLLGISFLENSEHSSWETIEFCSQGFVRCRCGCSIMLPRMNYEKLFCTLLIDENPDPILLIQKLGNILPLLWPNKPCYEWADLYFRKLSRNLIGSTFVLQFYKTDAEIVAMWHGWEAQSDSTGRFHALWG